MTKKLYVGNLSPTTSQTALDEWFAPHGTVESATILTDRDTGQSRGFGFVEMGTEEEAQAAIAALNGKQLDGREVKVSEAKPREDRPRGGGGGGGFRNGRR